MSFNAVQNGKEKRLDGYVASLKQAVDNSVKSEEITAMIEKLALAMVTDFCRHDLNVNEVESITEAFLQRVFSENPDLAGFYKVVAGRVGNVTATAFGNVKLKTVAEMLTKQAEGVEFPA